MRPLAEGWPGGPVGGEPGGRRAAGPGSLVFWGGAGEGGRDRAGKDFATGVVRRGAAPAPVSSPLADACGWGARREEARGVGASGGGGRRLGGGGKNRPGPDARRLSTFGRRPVRRAGGRRAAGPGSLVFLVSAGGCGGGLDAGFGFGLSRRLRFGGAGEALGARVRGAFCSLVCKASEGPYRRGAAGGRSRRAGRGYEGRGAGGGCH